MSALGFIMVLALAGALLHLAWHLVLATLIWAPSAAGAIGIGWSVTAWTGNVALGIGVAIFAATIIRAGDTALENECVLYGSLYRWSKT